MKKIIIKKKINGMNYLNLGCGKNYFSGWNNVDLYTNNNVDYGNLEKKLLFPDNIFDVAYCSHALEHLRYDQGIRIIKEVFRVLRPQGIFRLVVPDLEQICREYLSILEKCAINYTEKNYQSYNWIILELLDQMVREESGGKMIKLLDSGNADKEYILFRTGDEFVEYLSANKKDKKLIGKKRKSIWPGNAFKIFFDKRRFDKSGEKHKWMYDRVSLKQILEGAGFQKFTVQTFDKSFISDWDKFNLDKSKYGNAPRKPDSLFVEAVKV